MRKKCRLRRREEGPSFQRGRNEEIKGGATPWQVAAPHEGSHRGALALSFCFVLGGEGGDVNISRDLEGLKSETSAHECQPMRPTPILEEFFWGGEGRDGHYLDSHFAGEGKRGARKERKIRITQAY